MAQSGRTFLPGHHRGGGTRGRLFQSVQELVRTIKGWLSERNRQPQRYVWRAEGAAILEKITRARVKLEEIMPDTSRTAH